EAGQLADLAALGLDWDGDVVRQSERSELYAAALERLDVYPCFCTRAEIREAASAPHGALAEGAYPGTCRELTAAQRAERERAGPVHTHVPLVLGPDGARLAKRHGAVTLADRPEPPERVRGILAASLGLTEAGRTPSMAELLERFDPATLPREPWTLTP